MDIVSAESRDRLLQAIDDEIKSLEESTRALKSRRNELAPISCLPPETLAAIFSFLFPFEGNENSGAGYLEGIRVTHVCRRWREVALNHPRLWSHINFVELASASMAEILARAKMAPLHLEADLINSRWDQVDAIERQVEAHISHTRHLCIIGELHITFERLVSSAPTLESLSLSHSGLPQAVIPVNLFNCTVPNLTSLVLDSCDISWKSPLLKGLRTLRIVWPSMNARPKLEDWLDALNEMPQLKTLILKFATPRASLTSPTSDSSHIITLPFLTEFYISAFAEDCALALAHLTMPTLTSLQIDAKSFDAKGEDVGPLIPHVARNVCGQQGPEPLRSILISSGRTDAKVVAWTLPDADLKERDARNWSSTSIPARFKLMFTATGSNWNPGVDVEIIGALLMLLPVDSVSTLATQRDTRLSKEFWLTHAPRWLSLERVSLVSTAIKPFRDMLAEDVPPDGPRLSSLTELILVEVKLTALKIYDLRDVLLERVEQGVPLKVLDLSTSFADCAIPLLREVVVDVKEPLGMHSTTMAPLSLSALHRRIGNRNGVEYDVVQSPWDDDAYDDEDEDGDEVEVEADYDAYDDVNYDDEFDSFDPEE